MDELREQCGAQIVEFFHTNDFSNIPGFPNFGQGVGDINKWLLVFHGNYGDSVIWHVKSFLQLMADSNVLYEDNMMEMFASTFQGDAYCWFYQGLPNKCINSFQGLKCINSLEV